MKSTFEKLPREVRDLIYGYCLIHDGEIIPYPTVDEVKQIEASGGTPAKRSMIRKSIEYNERELRSCAETKYATDWPSIALLGVSKGIREEAAILLFGMNVWRLSSQATTNPWRGNNILVRSRTTLPSHHHTHVIE